MKNLLYFSIFLSFISCGEQKGIRVLNKKEYWDNDASQEDRKLKSHTTAYQGFTTKFYHLKSYYENGVLKSYVIMEDDLLHNIVENNDMNGKALYYGDFIEGNGTAIEYYLWTGTKKSEGKYVDGNRSGWWKSYHFKEAYVLDSIYYKDGYPQYDLDSSDTGSIEGLLNLMGEGLKNNLYR